MEDREAFLARLKKIVIYRREKDRRRAPHKPLLLLHYLARVQQGRERLHRFSDLEDTFTEALRRFGPRRSHYHPEYPFWALTNDYLCEVKYRGTLVKKKNENKPTRNSLLRTEAAGGFSTKFYFLLREDRDLQASIAHDLLDSNFPVSLHEEIISYFGLRLPPPIPSQPNTGIGPEFRKDVLSAYGFKCAMSGYSIAQSSGSAGLEAAIICWLQVGGRAAITNAIAITTVHRKLFDLGLLSIDDDYRVILATHIVSDPATCRELAMLNNKPMARPTDLSLLPSLDSIRWHRKEVFKG